MEAVRRKVVAGDKSLSALLWAPSHWVLAKASCRLEDPDLAAWMSRWAGYFCNSWYMVISFPGTTGGMRFVIHYDGVSSACKHHRLRYFGIRSCCLLTVKRLSLGSLGILLWGLLSVLFSTFLVLGVIFLLGYSGSLQLRVWSVYQQHYRISGSTPGPTEWESAF